MPSFGIVNSLYKSQHSISSCVRRGTDADDIKLTYLGQGQQGL